jgi:peptidoglycan hydrolase-like protein with peptidoglycan-binding domain
MLTTPQLRVAWSPACDRTKLTVTELVQGVRVQCHRDIVTAVHALGRVLEAHGYHVRAGDTGGYNCRQITAGSGHSLHAFGIALDINWNTNPFRSDNVLVTDMPQVMVRNILRIRANSGAEVWGWGGNYRTVKDAMHYEIVCDPADLATGISWETVHQVALRPERPHRWPLVRRGDRGPAVEKLHDLLGVAAPGDPGYGIFGPRTEEGVREYQAGHGLTVDGVVGRQTWTALLTEQPAVGADEPGPVKRQGSAEPVAPVPEPTPVPA